MLNLLFNPTGRIGAQTFIRGALILLAIQFFFHLSAKISFGLFSVMSIVWLLSVYCWFCVFAKRFHDAGYSGALFIPLVVVWFIAGYFVWGFAMSLTTDPEILTQVLEISQEMQGSSDPALAEEALGLISTMLSQGAIAAALASFLLSGAVAFGINAILKSDPNENEHGQPVA